MLLSIKENLYFYCLEILFSVLPQHFENTIGIVGDYQNMLKQCNVDIIWIPCGRFCIFISVDFNCAVYRFYAGFK